MSSDRAAEFIERLSGTKGSQIVGFIVENSTIGAIRFEVAASLTLEEGDVVFTRIAGREIFYQILDAETAEESFDQNPRGTHIVRAAQLGSYDAMEGFTKFAWLPAMNTPLFTAKSRAFDPPILTDREFIVGQVPSTNVGVAAHIDDLVEYHTAILGVTGTGKTELALDIVREAVQRGVKVFCVDFTGDYRGARMIHCLPQGLSPPSAPSVPLHSKELGFQTSQSAVGGERGLRQQGQPGAHDHQADCEVP